MALGDVLDTIGGGLKKAGQVAGAVLPEVGQVIGDVADPEKARERLQRSQQLEDAQRNAYAQRIEQVLPTMDEGPQKQALYQQYFDLFKGPQNAPKLIDRLRQITNPGGMTAGPMGERPTSPTPGGAPGTVAQMLGNVAPVYKGRDTYTAFDIPGASVLGRTDIYGNQTDADHSYRRVAHPDGSEGLVPSILPVRGKATATGRIGMSYAQKLADMGMEFPDVTGKAIDVKKLGHEMEVIPIQYGGKTYYQLANQGQKEIVFNNQVVALPELEQINAGQEGVVLGQKRVPTVTQRQQVAVDPATGQAVKQTLQSTSTPMTPGAAVPAAQPAIQAVPQAAAPVQPQTEEAVTPVTPAQTLAAPPATKPRAAKPAAAPGAGTPPHAAFPAAGGKPLPAAPPAYMTPGMFNQQIQVARPLRVVSNQVFGDPTDPEFKGLSSYADVLDNPASRKRIANVSRLMIGELSSAEPSKTSGFWTLLTTGAGLPNALAAAQASQTAEAFNKLTPREQELVDSSMDTYGAMSGFRALTKGAASQFSMKNLEREIPLVGFSIPDNNLAKYAFYDKLGKIAEEVRSGARGNAVITKQERDFYDSQTERLRQQKESSRTPWSKSQWSAKHPDKDADKAAKAATDAGYSVQP
jgi:hypothetical protein